MVVVEVAGVVVDDDDDEEDDEYLLSKFLISVSMSFHSGATRTACDNLGSLVCGLLHKSMVLALASVSLLHHVSQ